MMRVTIGDLVMIDGAFDGTCKLVGIVVDCGEELRRIYGGGGESVEYVDIQWFDSKIKGLTRFSATANFIKILSKNS